MPSYSVASTGRSDPFIIEAGGIVSLSTTTNVTFEYTKDGPIAVRNLTATWNSVTATTLPIRFQEAVYARVTTAGTACTVTVDNSPAWSSTKLYVPDYYAVTGTSAGGTGSGGTLRSWKKTVAGTYSFAVPDDVYGIQLSGCGGGGSGGGGASSAAAAGGGGGPAPQHRRLILAVTPSSTLTVVVGAGGSAPAAATDGNDGTESYISGAGIISPFVNGSNQILLGYGLKGKLGSGTTGGDGGGAMMASTADAVYGTLNTGSAHASRWWYADGYEIVDVQMPICQGSGGGGSTSTNGGSRASSGFTTLNGRGLGLAGLGGGTWGGGGAGGGGGFARGGNGGATAGGAGSIGAGSGAGGGGGAGNTGGTGGAGGAGTDGCIEILYVSLSTVA